MNEREQRHGAEIQRNVANDGSMGRSATMTATAKSAAAAQTSFFLTGVIALVVVVGMFLALILTGNSYPDKSNPQYSQNVRHDRADTGKPQ